MGSRDLEPVRYQRLFNIWRKHRVISFDAGDIWRGERLVQGMDQQVFVDPCLTIWIGDVEVTDGGSVWLRVLNVLSIGVGCVQGQDSNISAFVF